jgi:hypothetical protein
MAVATTLIAPPLIKYLFAEDIDEDGSMDEIEQPESAEEFTRIG